MLAQVEGLYSEFLREVNKHFTPQEVVLIKKAYMAAEDLHRGQLRKSGEPYIIHPVYVAYILLTEAHFYEVNTIVAALLHDTIEDSGVNKEFLEKMFNTDVANLVQGVTNIEDVKFDFKKAQDQYDIKRILNCILKDFRVALIKLCDRLHNMRTLDYMKPEKQRYKSAETLSIYCPIALHLGYNVIKDELIDLSFKHLSKSIGDKTDRSNYDIIAEKRKQFIAERQEIIEDCEYFIKEVLASHKLNVLIRAHVKSTFTIYQSLANYRDISDIPNVLSFQIETDSQEDCYKVADILKEAYLELPEYAKDYIASPDPNGYEALHFSVIGKDDMPLRFRVFSKAMANVNRYGVSALMENPTNSIDVIQARLQENNAFIRALKENYQFSEKPFLYIQKVIRNIITTKIIVFDTMGVAYELPNMSTAYDFACSLKSGLDEKAIGARVNSVEVPLEFLIRGGDVIEILTERLDSNFSRVRENKDK